MSPTTQGSLRIARIVGIDVFVHWSWAAIALVEISYRSDSFSSPVWNILEYLSVFAIVLMHEFGHALACRSVGGSVARIVLWPLGGIAYVQPPERPGAVLWSIVAGPLVNVALVPLPLGAIFLAGDASPNVAHYLQRLATLNGVLLVFNLLPFYPLDGGQIVRAFFWFFLGRARSLVVATVIGLGGAGLLAAFAVYSRSAWLGVLAAFNGLRSWNALQGARALRTLEKAPRREGPRCPHCEASPPAGAFWVCPCGAPIDLFADAPVCPTCKRQFVDALCIDCHVRSPWLAWMMPMPEIPPIAAVSMPR